MDADGPVAVMRAPSTTTVKSVFGAAPVPSIKVTRVMAIPARCGGEQEFSAMQATRNKNANGGRVVDLNTGHFSVLFRAEESDSQLSKAQKVVSMTKSKLGPSLRSG